MDWPTFIGVVVVLLFAVIPMMAFQKQVKQSSQTSIVPFQIQLVLCIYLWGLQYSASFYT